MDSLRILTKLTRIRHLVLCGGGTKGLYLLGALRCLEQLGMLAHVNHLYGTSVGACGAAGLALGYSVSELTRLAIEFPFDLLVNRDLGDILASNCLVDDDAYTAFLTKFITRKGFGADLTLQELESRTGNTVHFVAFDMSRMEMVELTPATFPTMTLVTALKMTTAFPLIFQAVTDDGRWVVDGGVYDNFPMRLVPEAEQKNAIGVAVLVRPLSGDSQRVSPPTFAAPLSLVTYTTSVLYAAMQSHYAMWKNAIYIHDDGGGLAGSFDISTSKEEKLGWVEKGHRTAKASLSHVLNYLIHKHIKDVDRERW